DMNQFLQRFFANKGAIVGTVIFAIVIAVAIFASVWYESSPWMMMGKPLIKPFQDPNFWFGTDMLGRDIGAGLAHGARVSLMISVSSTVVAVFFGILIGAMAGYYGGWIDDVLMRITEFFQTIPQLAMAIVVVAIFTPSIYSIVCAIVIVSWPPVARLVRSEFMSLKQREFVHAAIGLGQKPRQIIFSQILPNALSPIIVMASLMVATALLTEAALS